MNLVLCNLWSIFNRKCRFIVGSNTTITGKKNILTSDFIDIGIIGCHNLFEKDKTILNFEGTMIVNGHASIGKGTNIHVKEGKKLIIGNNTYLTGRSLITVNNGVSIGDNCALSWNLTIIDDDYHELIDQHNPLKAAGKSIVIGNSVWIGCNVIILKGVEIADGIVIAANSVVTSSINEKNVLIGGNPARIIRRDIKWCR